VSARHAVTTRWGVPADSGLRGRIFANIKFDCKIRIAEALSRMNRVLQFFELMVGRYQNILEARIYTNTYTEGDPPPLGSGSDISGSEVYVSMNPKHQRSPEEGEPSPFNVLIDPVRDSETFSSVLKAWLARDEDADWQDARMRLSSGWGGRVYNQDRLMRAVSMFEYLPKGVFPNESTLSQEEQDAIEKAKKIFHKLHQDSIVRKVVLNKLGNIDSLTLKKRVRHRAVSIINAIGHATPELSAVISKAVDCRNLYVHGNNANVTPKLCGSCLSFLTDTLEFIFLASDLVDAGWDIASWSKKGRPLGHPLFNYLTRYEQNLEIMDAVPRNP